jgi:protein-L-isoaspartate(D-aspartate) O-methyltransferase
VGRVILAAALGAGLVVAGCSRASDVYEPKRLEMVERQIAGRGVKDPRVLEAMRTIPRHLFVPEAEMPYAYEDRPLPIGSGQTISQPYIVAFMTEQLHLTGNETVLEIGTGSGYQTAVLARVAKKVYTIEIRKELADEAAERLKRLGITNAEVKTGDGYMGWPEHAPFDGILVTAAPERIPPPLLEQLASPGRMVIPVGAFYQELKVIKREGAGYTEKSVLPVRFVPFVRETPNPPPAPER